MRALRPGVKDLLADRVNVHLFRDEGQIQVNNSHQRISSNQTNH